MSAENTTIKEVQEAKIKLEAMVLSRMRAFEKAFGVKIHDVTLERTILLGGADDVTGVNIEIGF